MKDTEKTTAAEALDTTAENIRQARETLARIRRDNEARAAMLADTVAQQTAAPEPTAPAPVADVKAAARTLARMMDAYTHHTRTTFEMPAAVAALAM